MDDGLTVTAQLSGLSDIKIIGQADYWEEDLLGAIGVTVISGTDDGSFKATTDSNSAIVVTKES